MTSTPAPRVTFAELAALAARTAPHPADIARRATDAREPNGRRHRDIRPTPRRQGTRHAAVAAALREV